MGQTPSVATVAEDRVRAFDFREATTGGLHPSGTPVLTHVTQAEVTGDLTKNGFQQGMVWAKQRYPHLQGHIRAVKLGVDGSSGSMPTTLHIPEDAESVDITLVWSEVAADDMDQQAQDVFEDELTNGQLHVEAGPLWRAHVLSVPGLRSVITLVTYHAIDDQPCVNALLHGMLDVASRPGSSPPPAPEPLPIPSQPMSSFIPPTGVWAKIWCTIRLIWGGALSGAVLPPKAPSSVPLESRRNNAALHLFTADETEALRHAARAHGSTVHGVLLAAGSAAAAWALKQDWGTLEEAVVTDELADQQPLTIGTATAVDMRRRLDPAITGCTAEHMVFFQGGALLPIVASPTLDIIKRAEAVSEELHTRLDHDVMVQLSMRQAPETVIKGWFDGYNQPGKLGRALGLTVTNVGVEDTDPQHGDLRLVSVRWASPVALAGASFLLSAITIGGRLCLGAVSCDAVVGSGATRAFLERTKQCLLPLMKQNKE